MTPSLCPASLEAFRALLYRPATQMSSCLRGKSCLRRVQLCVMLPELLSLACACRQRLTLQNQGILELLPSVAACVLLYLQLGAGEKPGRGGARAVRTLGNLPCRKGTKLSPEVAQLSQSVCRRSNLHLIFNLQS